MNLNTIEQAAAVRPNAARQPAVFIGHGSPMNIVRDNAFTQSLTRLGERHGNPSAALVVSAHWLTRGSTSVAVNPKPATIHDFGGFPEALYQVEYPAPGCPAMAQDTASGIKSIKVHENHEMGLDHGAWSILRHVWPKADVPVFQMSIDYGKPPQFHYELGQELRRLRNRGVLILGSGNITHNLRMISPIENDPKHAEWAVEFDDWAKKHLLAGNKAALVDYQSLGRAAQLSVPTNDHDLPLLYTLGAMEDSEHVNFTHQSFQHSSISMRCFETV